MAQIASTGTKVAATTDQEATGSAASKKVEGAKDFLTLASPQYFVCSGEFNQKQCSEEMTELRKVLAIYPATRLGNWTWVLVRASEWKEIVVARGLDPDSPAFSYLPKRETFIEDSLLKPAPVRSRELLLKWNLSIPALLDFAIRHELGHALCNYNDERAADEVADSLKQGKAITCKQPTMARKRR